jgi:hypothetical protein
VGRIAGEEADLPQVHVAEVAQYVRRVGRDDDHAAGPIPCCRLIVERAFASAFQQTITSSTPCM